MLENHDIDNFNRVDMYNLGIYLLDFQPLENISRMIMKFSKRDWKKKTELIKSISNATKKNPTLTIKGMPLLCGINKKFCLGVNLITDPADFKLSRKKTPTAQACGHPLMINGWSMYAHPLFLDQQDELIREVERLRARSRTQGDPDGYRKKSASKRLAAINKLIREVIPRDPGHADFRQGLTLGPEHRHWRRAKFFQQYRLFFRFHQDSRVIVLAWVNDETTKRAYGARSDAYRVFQGMLRRDPPNDWDNLVAEVKRL